MEVLQARKVALAEVARRKLEGASDSSNTSTPAMWRALAALTDKLPPPGHDGNKPLLRNPRGLSPQDKATGNHPKENLRADRLKPLFAKGLLSPQQYEAANRFTRDCEQAQIASWQQVPWHDGMKSRGSGNSLGTLSDAKLMAQDRMWRAIKHVGPSGAQLLMLVAINGHKLSDCRKILHWDHKATCYRALLVALDALASHYNLIV